MHIQDRIDKRSNNDNDKIQIWGSYHKNNLLHKKSLVNNKIYSNIKIMNITNLYSKQIVVNYKLKKKRRKTVLLVTQFPAH